MALKPKRKVLREPTVFQNKTTGQWVCEYEAFDENGKIKKARKSFKQDLIKEGKEGTRTEQHTAALAFKEAIVQKQKKEFNQSRAERQQKILSARELNEAKTAFGLLAQLPANKRDLIEAVSRYVESVKLEKDTPPLEECLKIFLANYDKKNPNCTYKVNTCNTMYARLNPFRKFMLEKYPGIKIGEVTEQQIIEFIKSRDTSGDTRQKYLSYVQQFFARFSDPKDKHRFIEANPADSAKHYLKHNEKHILKTPGKPKVRIIRVLQYEESKYALQVAYEARKHGILGYAVLALLVGMRPSEIHDMVNMPDPWLLIRLDEGVLKVDGFGKQSDQRTIDLQPVAAAWLRLVKENGWPLCYKHNPKGRNLRYSNFRALTLLPKDIGERYVHIRRQVDQEKTITSAEKAFLDTYRPKLSGKNVDAYRHSFGTYLFYQCGGDLNYVTAQMGNSERTYYKHYKGTLIHPKDHEKFFKLGPDQVIPQS